MFSSGSTGGRVGSPAPNGNNNAYSEAQDDLLLKRLTILAHDIENISIKVCAFDHNYRMQLNLNRDSQFSLLIFFFLDERIL